jgi:hypothetical protein
LASELCHVACGGGGGRRKGSGASAGFSKRSPTAGGTRRSRCRCTYRRETHGHKAESEGSLHGQSPRCRWHRQLWDREAVGEGGGGVVGGGGVAHLNNTQKKVHKMRQHRNTTSHADHVRSSVEAAAAPTTPADAALAPVEAADAGAAAPTPPPPPPPPVDLPPHPRPAPPPPPLPLLAGAAVAGAAVAGAEVLEPTTAPENTCVPRASMAAWMRVAGSSSSSSSSSSSPWAWPHVQLGPWGPCAARTTEPGRNRVGQPFVSGASCEHAGEGAHGGYASKADAAPGNSSWTKGWVRWG